MKRLVILRHGESRWNAEARIQGQSCNGLSPTGFAQAAATAAAVVAEHPRARLVASDLQRALETAGPLAAGLGVEPERDERLRERSFGAWETQLRDEVVRTDPERWQRWLQGEDVVPEVGGEAADELADRAAEVFLELLAATPDDGVTVAVTHGGTVWNGLHRALDLPFGTLGGVDNASLTELVRYDDASTALGSWNVTAHLPQELRTGWSASRRRVEGSAGTSTSDAPPVGR